MTGSSKVLTGDAVAKKPTARSTVGPLLRSSWGASCGISTRPSASTSSCSWCSAIFTTAEPEEDEHDLLGAVGVAGQPTSGVELEVDERAALGAGCLAEREVQPPAGRGV
jgi:hypothetical protein